MAAIDIGHRHAPRDIARDAERHERLTGAEAHAPAPQRLMRGVALLPAGEGHHEGPLAVRGLGHGVLGQLAADGLEGLAELHLHVELGGKQPLLHGLGDHGAHGLVRLELLGVALDGIEVARQVEVEVVHRAQLGHFARERALGGDELLRLELMTQIAFIGVGLLGLAALDGAAPDHLATVQELTGPGVVELFGGELLQLALLVQAVDHLGRHALVHAKRRLQAGSAVQVAGDLEVAQRLGLAIVIALDIIANRALELAGIDLLAIALHDGRAIAIRARDEHHVLAAQAVAEEAGVEVSRYEDAAHVPEVQALVAVGHARGHDGATRPGGTVGSGEMLCHGEDPFRMDAQVETTYKRPLSHSGPSSRVVQWDSPNVPLRPGRKPCRERRERRARAASTT